MTASLTIDGPSLTRTALILTRTALIEGAQWLKPRVQARGEETDSLRRLPASTLSDIRALGLNRVLQPNRFGGAETDWSTMQEVCAKVASGCGSSGWVLAQYAIHAFLVAGWPVECQEEIWGPDPGAMLSGSLVFPAGRAKRDAGGYRVSGRWPFASGVDGCDWHMCSAMLEPENAGEAPAMIMFMAPKFAYEIIDTWHVIGLRGTGSHDVKLDNAFIPAHRALTVDDTKLGASPGAKFHGSALYRVPPYPNFGFVQGGAAVGIATGMYEVYVAETRSRVAKSSGKALTDFAALQLAVAEAGACIDAARALMASDTAEMMRLAEAGGQPTMEQRTKLRRDGAFASQLCNRAVNRLYALGGGSALYEGSVLNRYFRDSHAANAHITMNWEVNATSFGRVALGLPNDNPAL